MHHIVIAINMPFTLPLLCGYNHSVERINMSATDHIFLNWLIAQIKTGTTTVVVPAHFLENVSKETMKEAGQLAKLSGVELVVKA